MFLPFWSGSRHNVGWLGESLEVLTEIFSSMGVTVISCPKLINSLAQILAFNFVVTRASIGNDIEQNMSPGLSFSWARATLVKGSPDSVWTTEATDPVASAPMAPLVVNRSILNCCFCPCWGWIRLVRHNKAGERLDHCIGGDHWCWCCCFRWSGAGDAAGAVRLRWTLGTSGPELCTTFLDRDGRGEK